MAIPQTSINPSVATPLSSVKTVGRISHEEAKKFYYALGQAFEENPTITQDQLFQKVEMLWSKRQLLPILEDMVDQGFLLPMEGRFGYETTIKFCLMQNQLQEWSALTFSGERATAVLVDPEEQEEYIDQIVALLEKRQESLGFKEISESIQGINSNQVLHLLEKLTKQGRLIEGKDSLRRLWQLNPEYEEPEEPLQPSLEAPNLEPRLKPLKHCLLAR